MSSYRHPTVPGAGVALNALTPTKLFSTHTTASPRDRRGWRLTNSTAAVIYVLELPPGTTDPTFADMITSKKYDYAIAASTVQESGATEADVWAILASGAATVYPREIK